MKASEFMRRDPLTIGATDSISLARQLMLWAGARHLPVLVDDKVVGVISERDLATKSDPEMPLQPVDRIMSSPAHTCSADDSLTEISARMAAEKVGCLPVTDKGKLVGLVTTTDVLAAQVVNAMKDSPEPGEKSGKLVADVMTREPLTGHADDSLLDAVAAMGKRGVRHLPIIDGVGNAIGILADSDIRFKMAELALQSGTWNHEDARIRSLTVNDVMASEPATVTSTLSCSEAASYFASVKEGAFLVVDDDKLIGILSYVDVLRGLAS
jgi:CBS domain-containing protein